METYMTVIKKDFLLDTIVENGGPYVMRGDSALHKPENQEFVEIVQKSRPVSDFFYMPVRIDRYFFGYWAIGRAGLSSPFFSEEESGLFRFLAPYVNEVVISAIGTPLPQESTAYLDYQGNLIDSDLLFKHLLIDCFRTESTGLTDLSSMFMQFIHGPMNPNMDSIRYFSGGKTYSFKFRLLPASDLRPKYKGIPFASVMISEIDHKKNKDVVMPSEILLDSYNLTRREMQVVKEITRGFSNKIIAGNLGVDESTIKRHTHNIYEKTGFKSRVELLLGLKTLN